MAALAAAIFTAALALGGKVVYDLWERAVAKRNMAAALAGEMRAYIELLNPQKVAKSLSEAAATPKEVRTIGLRALSAPPAGHPVFDKVAGNLGILSTDLVRDVSMFYNIVTNLRLMLAHLSSDRFIEADERIQTAYLIQIARP